MEESVGCIRCHGPHMYRQCALPPSIRLRHGDLLGSVMANTGSKTNSAIPPRADTLLSAHRRRATNVTNEMGHSLRGRYWPTFTSTRILRHRSTSLTTSCCM